MTALSPTPRTTVRRGKDRARSDRDELHAFLRDALVAHVGLVVGPPGAQHPVVLPTAFAIDPDGPDDGGTLYLHGSVAAAWLRQADGADVCVTVTELDGLVAARSAFHHSMNYRSAVVIGRARVVTDPDERAVALAAIVDHMVPGRMATLRPNTRKELAATGVLALALREASLKQRTGGPVDDPADLDSGVWAGVVPLRRVTPGAVSSDDSHDEVPADVVRRVASLR